MVVCNHSIENEKHHHVLVEFTKESTDLHNQMTSKSFFAHCRKIAVNYNSINNLDVSGVPVRRRLPQVCFGSQTKSVHIQTDMITNVTIECFTGFLIDENVLSFLE